MNDTAKKDVLVSFKRPSVMVVLLVLLFSAIGLNAAVQSLQLHFKKEAVALRRDLTQLPERLGPWVQILRDKPLSAESEHALGTKDYITRFYVDSRFFAPGQLDNASTMTDEQRENTLNEARRKSPRALIYVHLAYYTGQADTVAHVPERCMSGGGFDIDTEKTEIADFTLGGTHPAIRAKYMEFQQRENPNYPKQNVAYMFQVNGGYEYDSLGVRKRLQSLIERYAYYCKIELMTYMNTDTAGAKEVMDDFLTSTVPEIEKCLPDWQAVTGKKPAATQSVMTLD